MMDGRVKTLHPKVQAGFWASAPIPGATRRGDVSHGIEAIDLLVVNLYPFEATAAPASL